MTVGPLPPQGPTGSEAILTPIARLVDPRAGPREVAPPLAWLAYVAGAIAGGVLSRWTDGGATVAVGAAVVVAAALPVPRGRQGA